MRRVFRDCGYIMRGIVRWSGRLRGVAPLAVVLALVFVVQPSLTTLAQVVPPPPAPPAAQAVPVIGEIERLTLNTPGDVWSGGTIVVGGQSIIIPRNLLIDFPANRLTLQQTFAQAPAACVANGESGLAKLDKCNTLGNGAQSRRIIELRHPRYGGAVVEPQRQV